MTQDDTTARPANPDDAGMPKSGDPGNLTGLSIDAELLRLTLDGRWDGVREQVRQLEIKSYSPPAYDVDTESHRARILERLHELSASGLPQIGFPAAQGGAGDIGGGMVTSTCCPSSRRTGRGSWSTTG